MTTPNPPMSPTPADMPPTKPPTTPPDPTPAPNTSSAPASGGDEPLGAPGLSALHAEREARKALERELATLAPLKKLAEALGAEPGKPNGTSQLDEITTRLANHEQQLATEREARWRAEVAHEKGLTPQQAAELRGSTRDELAGHADRLLTLFNPTPASGPPPASTPRSDPSQGARPGVQPDPWNEGKARALARYGNQQQQTPGS